MRVLLVLVLLLPFVSGCGLKDREEILKKREAALAQREQAVLEKENLLALKETELQKKQQQLDSTRLDSVALYHNAILGEWNAVMTCTETTCPGSAIGDTKSESWVFTNEQGSLVAKAMAGEKVVRIYTGTAANAQVIELTASVEPTPTTPATKMVVRLTPADDKTLQGQRHIIRESGCSIMYALKLTRN